MRGLLLVLVSVCCLPAVAAGQWLKLPTQGVPRNADGTPNLKAPAPRLPDGKPDFSGIWHAGNRNPCVPGTGAVHRVRQRDRRIAARRQPWPGSAGRPAVSAVGGRAREETHGGRQPRRSARALPARQPAAALDAAAPHQGDPHAETAGTALRSERDVPADPHRRPAAARRHEPVLDGLFDRALGRRHARRADRGVPRRSLARHGRQRHDQRREDDRADHGGRTTARSRSISPSTIPRSTRSRSR